VKVLVKVVTLHGSSPFTIIRENRKGFANFSPKSDKSSVLGQEAACISEAENCFWIEPQNRDRPKDEVFHTTKLAQLTGSESFTIVCKDGKWKLIWSSST